MEWFLYLDKKFFVFKLSPLAIGVKFFYDKHIDCKQSATSRFVFSEDIIPVRRCFYICLPITACF